MSEVLWLLVLLQVKHFVCDFPLQWKYQYANKGAYGHPGGTLHAGIHTVASYAVLAFFVPLDAAFVAALVEGAIHYHIDWAKMRLNAHFEWGPLTHERFWWLLGFDQLLHQLTYVAMIWAVLK